MAPLPAWQLAAHPVFVTQLNRLAGQHDHARPAAQRARIQVLAMLRDLCLKIIPADPMRPTFDPTETERPFCGHWRRACFGAGRFMLLFRADPAARILIFGCVIDLEAPDRAMPDPAIEEKQPVVVLGCLCPMTREGRVSLPGAWRDHLDVRAGGYITLRTQNARQPVLLEPAEPHASPLTKLAQRLRAAAPAATPGKQKPGGMKPFPPDPPALYGSMVVR